MKNIACFLITLFFVESSYSARFSRWRLEYSLGKTAIDFEENFDSSALPEKEVYQTSLYQELLFQYFLAPPFIDFSLGIKAAGFQHDSPDNELDQFNYITGFTNFGFIFPLGKKFKIRLVTEYFYTTMIVEDDAFGFSGLTGFQVYPEFEYFPEGSTLFFNYSPYIKFPLWTDVGNRKETTVGVKFKIPTGPLNKQRFPNYAFQNGFIINLFYTYLSLEIDNGNDFVDSDVEIKQYGVNLGFNF